MANWFQWEGLGWSWIGEANRIVYERALVVFLALSHDSQCQPLAMGPAGGWLWILLNQH